MRVEISAETFQQLLLSWFDHHGRKNLPWQQNKTPYRVWVSEIMLQQTQVAAVVPYFERFMARFPDLASLAVADEDAVLHLWAGLGYYSRARNLLRAAKKIMTEFHGCFPNTLQELQTLPGVGLSTAGAILTIAFGKHAAILDGNVKRVLCRLHAIPSPVDAKETEKKLWNLAQNYAPYQRTADYTQAMMDLGATLCTRTKPACPRCPFHAYCDAHRENIAGSLPKKKTTKRLPARKTTFLIVKKDQRIFLRKRPSSGIWGGLWSFPEIEGQPVLKHIRQVCLRQFQTSITHYQELNSFRHTFTHFHLDIFPVVISVKKNYAKVMEDGYETWYDLKAPHALGLPKPVQTILEYVTGECRRVD